MACENIWRFLLIISVAVCSIQAQQQSSTPNPDEIIFPGQTERPARFPINPQESPNVLSTTPSAAYTQCFDNCLSTSEYNPVCGSDGIVYSNPGRLGCANSCGKRVDTVKYGQCVDNWREG